MSSDFTQNQSTDEQIKAERLSLQATQPPTQVPGYRIERLLGQGAFGQVWVGRDLNTGRQVAIKFYLHRGGVNWTLLSREVKHLVSMSANRYIVQVLEVGWNGEPPYYVMEFLENGSLDDLLRKVGPMPVGQAVSLFSEIAQGLNHSHGKGVLHCDLKPANILLDQDLRPRLADFGQSRMSSEQTPSLGTLFYMAPEQADLSAPPDARWDVYALGAIMHSMVVGVPPYRNATTVHQLDTATSLSERLERYQKLIISSPPQKQHHRVKGMDRALAQIIDKCIAKRPAERFGNVQQVLEALSERQEVRTRRPLQLLGIVGPLLLLVVMGIFSMRSVRVAEQESLERLQKRALESNRFAAMFAARSLERELAELFRLLEEQASTPEFYLSVKGLTEEDQFDQWLVKMRDPHERKDVPKEFREFAARAALDKQLDQLLNRWRRAASNNLLAKLNSLFVADARGTTFAVAFSEPTSIDQSPVGMNFAYRSYFNGLRDDAPRETPSSSLGPTQRTHLSAAFKSTSTGTWKVAVSTPIRVPLEPMPDPSRGGTASPLSNSAESSGVIIGVLSLTLELADIRLLDQAAGDRPDEQLAVLIDGRSGDHLGTLLYHPALEKIAQTPVADLTTLDGRFQIDETMMARLSEGGVYDYQDPVTASPMGDQYKGDWIAAVQRVELPHRNEQERSQNQREASDLWMLVQERSETVTEPVRLLGSKMTAEGLVAVVTVLFVIIALWLVVWRLSGRKEGSLLSAFLGETPQPTAPSDMAETIPQ